MVVLRKCCEQFVIGLGIRVFEVYEVVKELLRVGKVKWKQQTLRSRPVRPRMQRMGGALMASNWTISKVCQAIAVPIPQPYLTSTRPLHLIRQNLASKKAAVVFCSSIVFPIANTTQSLRCCAASYLSFECSLKDA